MDLTRDNRVFFAITGAMIIIILLVGIFALRSQSATRVLGVSSQASAAELRARDAFRASWSAIPSAGQDKSLAQRFHEADMAGIGGIPVTGGAASAALRFRSADAASWSAWLIYSK